METVKREVPKLVKSNIFGCMNCLWHGVECKHGELYKPEDENGTKANTCYNYTYYD